MSMIDLYLTEMNRSDIMKIVKTKDVSDIVELLSNASDKEKEMIMNLVDDKTKKKLDKFVEGGLI